VPIMRSMKLDIKTKKQLRYFVLIIVLLTAYASCRKECRNIEVPDIKCDKRYNEVQAEILYRPFGDIYLNPEPPKNIYIADSATYDSIFFNKRPFGNLNFNDQFIIGFLKLSNAGFEVHVKAKVCEHEKENKLKLKVKYSVYSQCAGSNISPKPITVWAILPIKYVNYNIEYEIEDINPGPG